MRESSSMPEDRKHLAGWHEIFFYGAAAAILILRAAYCFLVPLYSTDVLRNLGYGMEFPRYGFRVYELTPYDFSPRDYQYFWPNHHYTYPVVTLLFYALLAALWPSIVSAKLALTAIDGLNAVLIHRITRDRWCALLYWAYPACVWFASREGQFEPLVNMFSLLAIFFLQRRQPMAWLFLALAVQTKFFPVFLVPYALSRLWGKPRRDWIHALLWGLAGMGPSFHAIATSRYLDHLFQPGYVPINNPISWALFHPGLHAFTPFWLVLSHWLAGLAFVLACLWFMKMENRWVPYFAPLVFVVFVKANRIGQFWYMMITPAFCLTVENPRHRRVLLLLALLFGIRSLYSIFVGPVGYVNPDDVTLVLERCMFGI